MRSPPMLDDYDPYALTDPEPESVTMPEGGDSLDFLRAVYRDPAQPMHTRIRCAGLAIKYERPALAVTVLHNAGSFEAAMEQIWERSKRARLVPAPRVIEHSPVTPVCSAVEPEAVEVEAEPPERIRRRI